MSLFLDLESDMNIEEVLTKNVKTASELRKKISLLDQTENISDEEFLETEDILIQEELIESTDEEEFEYYYNNILNDLSKCKTREEQKNAIYNNLPVLENKNYFNIIMRIILELTKEKAIYEELKDGESEEEILSLIKQQEEIDYQITLVRNHPKNVEDSILVKEKTKNKLIFLKTFTGRVYAESDLASISEEYYPAFKALIETIEDGTFRNVKRFSATHDTMKGISEVKDFKIRVVFDRIDFDTYIIIDIFVKKSDRDTGYIDQVSNRIDYYKKNKDIIIASIDNDYINEHAIIYDNLKQSLISRSIVKTKS